MQVELVGGDIWQVPIKRGPHDKGPFLLEPALSSFNAYLSKHRELESKQGQTPDNAEIPSARIRVRFHHLELALTEGLHMHRKPLRSLNHCCK